MTKENVPVGHGFGNVDIQPDELTALGRDRHGRLLTAGPDDQFALLHDAVQRRTGSGIRDNEKRKQADNHEANGCFAH